MATPISTIKNWFKTGMFPTQAQFWALFDSYRHKDENVPVEEIEGLNALFTPINNHFTNPNAHPELFDAILENNTIITDNGFTKEANLFTGLVDTLWNINGVRYTNPVLFEDTIELCSSGKVRMDRMVLDTNNSFFRVVGDEYDSNPVPQSKPINTLDYTFIPVSDTEVGTPTLPLLGTNFVKKTDSKVTFFNEGGSNVVIPFDPNGYSEIRLTNPSLVSVSGMELSLITGNSSAENPYSGKSFHFVNLTGNNVTFNQLNVLIADYPFLNKLGVDLVIPNGEKVEVKFDAGGLYEFDKSWNSKLFNEIQLLAYTSARNDGPNPNNKVLNVDASGNLKLHSMPLMPPPYLEELIPDSYAPSTTGNFVVKGSFFTPTTTVTVEGQTLNYLTFVSDNEILVNLTTGASEGYFDVTIDNGISVVFANALLIVAGDVYKPTASDWENITGAIDLTDGDAARISVQDTTGSANTKSSFFELPATGDFIVQFNFNGSPLEASPQTGYGYTDRFSLVDATTLSEKYGVCPVQLHSLPGKVYINAMINGGESSYLLTSFTESIDGTSLANYTFAIKRIGTTINFYRNNVLQYTAPADYAFPMKLKANIKELNQENIKIIIPF